MAAREAQHATKVQAARARQADEVALAARVQLESQRQTAAAQAIVRPVCQLLHAPYTFAAVFKMRIRHSLPAQLVLMML